MLSATLASRRPFGPVLTRTVLLEGREVASGQRGNIIAVNNVTMEYFRTLGIPLLKGRDFSPF